MDEAPSEKPEMTLMTRIVSHQVAVDDEEHAETQHPQAHDAQAHDEAAREGHAKCRRQPCAGRLGRAHIGLGGHGHPDEPGQRRTERAGHERHRDKRRRLRIAQVHRGEQRSHGDDEDRQHPVLPVQKRTGALRDGRGNFCHALVASVLLSNPASTIKRVAQGQQPCDRNEIDDELRIHIVNSVLRRRSVITSTARPPRDREHDRETRVPKQERRPWRHRCVFRERDRAATSPP